MKKQLLIWTVAAGTMLATVTGWATPRELNDAEMDAVCAGDTTELEPGDELNTESLGSDFYLNNSVNTINLSGNAQQNLTSFVNILAVNSAVQVLLNINVSINSDIGSVTQGNTGSQAH
jgi:hypothetical protein